MELQRVARRLAVDQGYRRRAAAGLRAEDTGGSSSADVLLRVKRLNDYITTGLAILDDGVAAVPAGPLPWERQPQSQPQPQPQQTQQASLAADSSSEDSDIEEEAGQDNAQALAALLAEAQAAVQRRQDAAAMTIQRAFRLHRAQALRQHLRDQRLAADRLVARALAAAYRGACGSRRSMARQAALRQLRCLRRWRLRQRRQVSRALAAVQVDSTEAAAVQQQQQQRRQVGCSTPAPEAAAAAEPPGQPGTPLPALQSLVPELPTLPTAWPARQADVPPTAPDPVATEGSASGRRVGTPPLELVAAPGPPPPGFLPAGRLHAGSRGGSPTQQQQPWQQRQASPVAQARSSSGGSGRAQGGPASPLHNGASPPLTAPGLHSSSSGRELYRRSSSIQLLEAVQLGIDGAGGSVASQAALGVCERAQRRVQELQRCASQGRPGTAGGGAGAGLWMGRVGSTRVVRQASGRAWGGEAIPE